MYNKEIIKLAAAKIMRQEMKKESFSPWVAGIAGLFVRGLYDRYFGPKYTDPWGDMQNLMMFQQMVPMLKSMDQSINPDDYNLSTGG